jgi:hypothetical protein
MAKASFAAVLRVSHSNEQADPTQYVKAGAPAEVNSNVTDPPLQGSLPESGDPPPWPPPPPESGDPPGGPLDVAPPHA